MITGNDNNLFIVQRSLVPERMRLIVGIAEISDVSGKHKYVSRRDKWIILQPSLVLSKLKMQVRCVL